MDLVLRKIRQPDRNARARGRLQRVVSSLDPREQQVKDVGGRPRLRHVQALAWSTRTGFLSRLAALDQVLARSTQTLLPDTLSNIAVPDEREVK